MRTINFFMVVAAAITLGTCKSPEKRTSKVLNTAPGSSCSHYDYCIYPNGEIAPGQDDPENTTEVSNLFCSAPEFITYECQGGCFKRAEGTSDACVSPALPAGGGDSGGGDATAGGGENPAAGQTQTEDGIPLVTPDLNHSVPVLSIFSQDPRLETSLAYPANHEN